MNEIISPALVETLKNFINKGTRKSFDSLVHSFVKLFYAHNTLIINIRMLESLVADENLINELDTIRQNLEYNVNEITEILEKISGRKLFIHIIEKGESLWGVSKKYNSKIEEICELNDIKSIFSLVEEKPILVPVKTLSNLT